MSPFDFNRDSPDEPRTVVDFCAFAAFWQGRLAARTTAVIPGTANGDRGAAINRNRWSRSIGIAGRDHPVRACIVQVVARLLELRLQAGDRRVDAVDLRLVFEAGAFEFGQGPIPRGSAVSTRLATHDVLRPHRLLLGELVEQPLLVLLIVATLWF